MATRKTTKKTTKKTTHGWEGSKKGKPPFHGAAAPFQKGAANPRHPQYKKAK